MRVAEPLSGYCVPPKAIADLADAPLTPHISLNPERTWMMVMAPAAFPSIAELARPELRLAGLRIDPDANGLSRQQFAPWTVCQQLNDEPARCRLLAPRRCAEPQRMEFHALGQEGLSQRLAGAEVVRGVPALGRERDRAEVTVLLRLRVVVGESPPIVQQSLTKAA